MQGITLSPSDFVALLNQTLEYAYPSVTIVGEIANFKVSLNKWVYFDLKDEYSSVKFFGTVYSLSGPLENGMKMQVTGRPRMHDKYGFSVQVNAMQPVGEGTIKKAADLLAAKLKAEGLFDIDRKRSLPYPPQKIGLIASLQSAAYADFIKVITARYGGIDILVYDVQVQGEQAVVDIVAALKYFGEQAELCDVLVLTRGGGSADDLAAFAHEQVVRAVAASRVPTLVAIGHEVDISLAELAADARASTPSNAAELLVPDKKDLAVQLNSKQQLLDHFLISKLDTAKNWATQYQKQLTSTMQAELTKQQNSLDASSKLLELLNPSAALKRGYSLVYANNQLIRTTRQAKEAGNIQIKFSDGSVAARVQ